MADKIKCLASVALFAAYPALAKLVLENNSPAVVTFLTEILSVAVLLLVFGIFPEFKKILALRHREGLGPLFIMGLLAGVAGPLFSLMGFRHSSVLNGVLLISLQTPLVLALAYIFLRERVRAAHLAGMGLLAFGLVLYSTDLLRLTPQFTPNDIYFVLAAVSFGVSNIIYKRKLSHIAHELILINRNLLGALVIFAGLIFFSAEETVRVSFDPASLAGIALIVVVPIILAQTLWYSSLEKIKSSEAGFFDALYPVFATLIAFIFLREAVGLAELAGGAIMVAGLIASEVPLHSRWLRQHQGLQSFKQH
ncbi:MAG: Membrane protein containing DUF6, transmembrane [Candidatus Magasanikbacteria bacterium GW2011_GWA2_56_11]|uniref:Membrane protein containing DUF6, transmembrane n=1 Tax=Candidatus Magasanikbacteria bacterium GW2011_GWA2_56_11 TaxID=1619044 RepID=A0A0G1YHY7_9BACT|nr:MAG: Membrane protein containing DUF6, transmembrane [Candidatus Magasanikbacteria bacterium GW2011_GWA2_56_11]